MPIEMQDRPGSMSQPGDNATFVAGARPTLKLAGAGRPELDAVVIEWNVEERVNAPARFELVLDNWQAGELRFPDRRLLDFGRTLELFGGANHDRVLFRGEIVGLGVDCSDRSPPRLRVVATDRLQQLADTVRTRSLHDLSDADLARRLAAEHSLQADVRLAGGSHRLLVQHDCSDLDFLRQRARVTDSRFWVADGRLVLRPFDAVGGSTPAFTLGNELLAFAVMADLRGQATSLATGGWNPTTKHASSAVSYVGVLTPDVPGGVAAATLREAAFGASPVSSAALLPTSDAETADLSGALMKAQARQFVNGSGRVAGAGEPLHAGYMVELLGLGGVHSGRYRLLRLLRRFDPSLGLFCEIEVQRNSINPA